MAAPTWYPQPTRLKAHLWKAGGLWHCRGKGECILGVVLMGPIGVGYDERQAFADWKVLAEQAKRDRWDE